MEQPPQDTDELAALQDLLFSRERKRLEWLESQVARYPTTEAVARALPDALRMASERSARLNEALAPPVESALQKSVAENPQPLVDVLFPILGPMIRKAVRSALDGMLQGLNQAAEYSLNPVVRFKAWRSPLSFAEYVVRETLVYRVEQMFLLHKETSLALQHASFSPDSEDPDMVAGMMSALQQAIQQFMSDSFQTEDSETVDEIRVGELEVHFLVGPNIVLAAAVRGTLPEPVKIRLTEFLESVEFRFAYELDNFEGDDEPFTSLAPEMEALLVLEREPVSTRPSKGALLILAALITLLGLALGFYALTEFQWSRFVENIEKRPGVLVTRVENRWGLRSEFPQIYRERHLFGLKDHMVETPELLEEDLGPLQPAVEFHWEPFQSDHPLVLGRRARSLLTPPETANLRLDGEGTLRATGFASEEWIERTRLQALVIPGVEAYDDSELQDIEPINRIRKKLKPPKSVELLLSGERLLANGKSPHEWLVATRKVATQFPEVTEYDDTAVLDLDLQRYNALKALLEGRSIYFQSGTANAIGDLDTVLAATAQDWKKLLREAQTLGKKPSLDVTGQSDAVGTKAQNEKLSLQRAAKIRDLLVGRGVEKGRMTLDAIQSPNEDPRLRRVIFLVTE